MNRYVYSTIEEQVFERKVPVILFGPPGIGKTGLLKQLQESGRSRSYVMIHPAIDRDFTEGLRKACDEGQSLCGYLSSFFGFDPDTVRNKMLVLIDGLEPLYERVSALFQRELPAYFAATTSRIEYFEIFRNNQTSTLEFVKVSGFSFYDFLEAVTPEDGIRYTDLLRAHYRNGNPFPELIEEEIRELFHDYLLTGGYPEAILQYNRNRTDLSEIRRVHGQLYSSVLMRYLNNLPEGLSPVKTLQLLNYIRDYAGDCRGQFHPGHIRRGAQEREFRKELEYLCENGVLIPVYRNGQFYRYEMADFGLLHYVANDYDTFYKLDNHENLPEYLYQSYFYHEILRRNLPVNIVKEGRSTYLCYTNGTTGFQHFSRGKRAVTVASDESSACGIPSCIKYLTDRKNPGEKSDHNIQYYFLEQTQF
ncbi:MAG: ATP-binding protein [Lachnospiraceae bacterium]|nr:ATP-binding protein [Lachnospiraceae bacterium]